MLSASHPPPLIPHLPSPAVGDDVTQSTVDAAAVFLLDLFLSDPKWSRTHAEEIKRQLGPFPASVATKVCSTVQRVASLLPAKEEEEEEDSKEKKSSGVPDEPTSKQLKKEFGHNIVFKHTNEHRTALRSGKSDGAKRDSLSSDSDEENGVNFTNTLLAEIDLSTVVNDRGPPSVTPVAASRPEVGVASPYGARWLEERCQECEGAGVMGAAWEDIHSAIFELLSSTGDNTAIQNDVSDAGMPF